MTTNLFDTFSKIFIVFAMVYIAYENLKTKKYSNLMILPLLILGLIFRGFEGFISTSSFEPLKIGLIGMFGILAYLMIIMFFLKHEIIGYGDIKLLAIVGLFLGFRITLYAISLGVIITYLYFTLNKYIQKKIISEIHTGLVWLSGITTSVIISYKIPDYMNFLALIIPFIIPYIYLKKDPMGKAYVLIEMGKSKEALEILNVLLETYPNNDGALNNKSWALNNLERFEEALYYSNLALSINSKDDLHWVNKGNAVLGLKRYEEAIECYNKALEINNKSTFSVYGRGLALFNLGEYEYAIKDFKRYLSINGKKDIDALLYLGMSFYFLQNINEALNTLDEAINKESDNALAYYYKANIFFELQDLQGALKLFETTVKINPEFADAFYMISKILILKNNIKDALTNLMKAIDLNNEYLDLAKNDQIFNSILNSNEFKDLIKQYE